MKAKYEWKEEDIQFPRYLIRNTTIENIRYKASVTYKIGWRRAEGEKFVCLISITDGMVMDYPSIEALLERLNNDGHGYRPLTYQEMVAVIKEQAEGGAYFG